MRRISLVLALMVLSAACGSTAGLGYGPGFTAGWYAADGVDTGVGHGIEAGVVHPSGWGGFATVDLAGYSSSGDADPIYWASLDVRRRFWLSGGGATRPYLAVGAGAGYQPTRALVTSAHFEAGIEWWATPRLALEAGLRERFGLFWGFGNPPTFPLSTLQAMLSVKVRIGGDVSPR